MHVLASPLIVPVPGRPAGLAGTVNPSSMGASLLRCQLPTGLPRLHLQIGEVERAQGMTENDSGSAPKGRLWRRILPLALLAVGLIAFFAYGLDD